MKTASEIQPQPRTAGRPKSVHGGRAHSKWLFFRHYLEMLAAMLVGMLVLGAVVRGLLMAAGVDYSGAIHPELTSLEMAFDMSFGMVVWMRHRGQSWASSLEMAGAMFAPLVVLFPLLWLSVIAGESLMALEHMAMLPLMFLVMLRRRGEYGRAAHV